MDAIKNRWKLESDVRNIPERDWSKICICHPDINNYIYKNYEQVNEDASDDLNFLLCWWPREFASTDCSKFIWPDDENERYTYMIYILQNMYEQSMCGYPCYEDAKKVHHFFWNYITFVERQKIINFIDSNATVTKKIMIDDKEIIHVFNWRGGFQKFAYAMCAIYQLSFSTQIDVIHEEDMKDDQEDQ